MKSDAPSMMRDPKIPLTHDFIRTNTLSIWLIDHSMLNDSVSVQHFSDFARPRPRDKSLDGTD